MSRSFTSRPSVTNARGRGRGTVTPKTRAAPAPEPTLHDRQTMAGVQGRGVLDQQQETNPPAEGQRMTHQGAYTMITPDEKKRQKVAEMAQKEQDAYASFKERNTQRSFNYVGTVGGGQVTLGAARQQTINNSPTKMGKLIQKEGRKSFMKQKEEEEIQQKRNAQRLKAQQNEERQQNDKNKWDEQKRRTNEAFLKRLENKSKSSDTGSGTSKDKTQSNPGQSVHPLHPYRSQIGQADVETTPTMGGAEGGAHEYSSIPGNVPTANTALHGLTVEEEKRLDALAAIFPNIDKAILIDILEQVGYSVDSAITLLQN